MMAGGGRRRKAWIDNPERMAGVRHVAGDVAFGPGPGFGKAAFRSGPGFGGPPFGGPPFAGGRGRRRRGDVRVALLMLIAEEPRNGYQLMQMIEERSGGRWRPSPGSIYPTLAQLEDEGLIRASEREGTKVFELTDSGREHLDQHRERTPPWVDDEEHEAFADLRVQIKQLGAAAMQVAHAGNNAQIASAASTLAEARRKIYRILAEEEAPANADD